MAADVDKEWILSRLETLTDHSESLANVAIDAPDNAYRPMTVLKLFVLATTVDVFTKIVPSRYDYGMYIDAMAGSGITEIRDRDDIVLGSPLIATALSHDPLYEYHFIEIDDVKAGALRRRLAYLADETPLDIPYERCEVHVADANEKIPELLDAIPQKTGQGRKGVNLLTFIDNEGPDIEWDAVERLGEYYGDVLVNFQSTSISRRRGKGKDEELDRFFGTPNWRHCDSEEQLRELYERQLHGTNKDITRSIGVESGTSGKRFYYEMIYGTTETESGSPYVNALDRMRSNIETLDGDDIDRVFRLLHGQQSLELFAPTDEEDSPREEEQTGLDQWT